MFFLVKSLLYAAGGGAMLTAGMASYLAFFQPPFYFPQPTGEYAVGTATCHWVDQRQQPDHLASHKELMVQLWYPAEGKPSTIPTEAYAPYFINHIKETYKIGWLVTMSRPMYSYAAEDALLIKRGGELPIIIFSHGFLSTRNHNTAQCEELASHGYIVVGISHSFGSCVTEFPGGRRVITDPIKHYQQFLENPIAYYKQFNGNINTWIDDVHMVINELDILSKHQSSPLYGRLAMNNIGMFGHSFGGAVTAQMCRHDERIKAGVAMDSPLFGPHATQRLNKPFMFLLADPMSAADMIGLMHKLGLTLTQAQEFVQTLHPSCIPAVNKLFRSIDQDVYKIILRNADHLAFCDIALMKEACLFSGVLHNMGVGSINGFRATEIVRSYLVAFFDKYLQSKPSELLDGEIQQYPECMPERAC